MTSLGILGWNEDAQAVFRALSGLEGAQVALVGTCQLPDEQTQEALNTRFVDNPALVLNSDAVQAIYISSGACRRCNLVTRALQAGKHVLLAPPLALDAAEAAALLDQASAAGLVLGQTAEWQGDPALDMARRQFRAGLFGEARLYQCTVLDSGSSCDWRLLAARELDLFYRLTGLRASGVAVRSLAGAAGAAVAALTVAYGDGALGNYVIGSGVAGADRQPLSRLLIASGGQLDLAGEPQAVRAQSAEDAPGGAWRPLSYVGARRGLEGTLAAFLRQVEASDHRLDRDGLLEAPRILGAALRALAAGSTEMQPL
ncbi:MAG: Gfo/Idh/MocA family oxidoreductase [Anaerolineae bacterium]|jgi:predicted dehydrogenase|nr:Gfo/Idh/MocA family oxidoreductase [Chloroflexota bacterium]